MVIIAIGSIVLYATSSISLMTMEIAATASFSMFLSLIVFSYLLAKGRTLREIAAEFRITRKSLSYRIIAAGIVLFIAVFLIQVLIAGIQQLTGIQLPTNVAQVVQGMPFSFILFSVFVAPINEEIFFRAFLVPRIGIVPSALLFGLLHFGYNSVSEVVGAVIYGLIAGYAFKKTNSLYPSLIGHILVNMQVFTLFV
jgi:hypothetical protein